MDNQKTAAERLSDLAGLLMEAGFLAGTYVLTIAAFIMHGKSVLLADDCTEWVLADHLNRIGKNISPDWYYGTELHVFFSQILNRTLLQHIPDWHMAHAASLAILLAALVLSILYLAKGLDLRRYGLVAAFAFTCPFGIRYRYFGLYSGFYLFYLVLSFLMLGLTVHVMKSSGIRRVLLTALLLGLAFLSGLNGVRHVLILFIPLFVTAFLFAWVETGRKPAPLPELLGRRSGVFFLLSLVSLLACGAGWAVNEKILSQQYYFWTYGGNGLRSFALSEFLDYLDSFVYLWGYQGAGDALGGTEGYGQLAALIMVVLLLGSFVFCLVHRDRMNDEQKVFVVFAVINYVADAALFYLGQQAEDRFILPAAMMAFVVLAVALRIAPGKDRIRRRLVILAFMGCLLLQSYGCEWAAAFRSERGERCEEDILAEVLVDSGYTQGISTFWNGANLTYLSSGKLEMWFTEGNEDEMYQALSLTRWEQSMEHTRKKPEGRAFLVVTEEDKHFFAWMIGGREPDLVSGGFEVYDFPHAEELPWTEAGGGMKK